MITFQQMKIYVTFFFLFFFFDIAYKTHYREKPLHINFDNVDGYILKYNKTRYLTLFHSNKKDERKF